ncbi:MAG: hypothetical protein CFE26_09890, partial [Verrucomicrobiales bacterium VVV1]
CSAPLPDTTPPSHLTRHLASQRLSVIVVTNRKSLDGWVGSRFAIRNAPGDADGGSATPITSDGYFLTADHVLAQSAGRHIFVVYGNGGNIRTAEARIVWRSYSGDLAVLHTPLVTPHFYRWTPPQAWLPAGTPIVHAGISTGFKSDPGKLSTALPPEGAFTGTRKFKIDVPLQPGDSGGPVIDARGNLVGVNSAVEFLVPMETAFFIDSEGNRPNVRQLGAIIARDRLSHPQSNAPSN